MELAAREGKQGTTTRYLQHLTYEQGHNISTVETLVAAAECLRFRSGGAAVRAYLESDEDVQIVLGKDRSAKKSGIMGVPFYKIDGWYVARRSHAANATACAPPAHRAAVRARWAGTHVRDAAVRHTRTS